MNHTTNRESNQRVKFDQTISLMFTNPLYNEYLFYASVISQIDVEFNADASFPAAVYFCPRRLNYALIINDNLFNTYSDEIRLGILKHEVLHIIWGHLEELEYKDLQIWQLATDCSINQFIERDHLPNGVILPETLKVPPNLSSYEYYDLLKDSGKYNPKETSEKSDHSLWEVVDKDTQKRITSEILEESRKFTIKNKGVLPNNIKEMISNISIDDKAMLNWKIILRRFIQIKSHRRSSIKTPNRRFNNKFIRGYTKVRRSDISVILDISGSIRDKDIKNILSEITKVSSIQGTPIKLVQIDTHPREPEYLTNKTKIFERKGTGGTYLSPALEHTKGDIIVITDGELFDDDVREFLKHKGTILWIIIGKNKNSLIPSKNTILYK